MRKPIVFALALMLFGCGVDVQPPEPTTVGGIVDRTLQGLGDIDKKVAEDKLTPQDVQQLITSITFLTGHMEKESTKYAHDMTALDEVKAQLTSTGSFRALPDPNWRPGQSTAPAETKVNAEPLKEPLAKLREILEKLKRAEEAS